MEGDSNEEVQEGAGSETGANAVPEKPEKRKTQALVSGGDDPATGGEGAEQQGEPTQEAGEGAGVVKPDDAATLLARLLTETGLQNEDDLVGMAKVGTSLMSRIDYLVEMPGTFHEWSPAEDPAEIVDDMFQHIEDLEEMRSQFRKLLPPLDVEELRDTPAGCAEVAAIIAYNVTLVMADEIRRKLLGPDAAPPERPIKIMTLMDMVAFVRKIGERATADVMGQQLRILKHRESAELSRSEAVAVTAFIHVLRALDGLARDEQAAIDRAEAARTRIAPAPLPIGETTMEPVDGPMDTWGGAA